MSMIVLVNTTQNSKKIIENWNPNFFKNHEGKGIPFIKNEGTIILDNTNLQKMKIFVRRGQGFFEFMEENNYPLTHPNEFMWKHLIDFLTPTQEGDEIEWSTILD